MSFRFIAALPCIVALAMTGAAHAQTPLANPWRLAQASQSCFLQRTYGSGAGKVDLLIQSFGPTSPYHFILRGPGLPSDKDRARPARVGFGGEDAARDSVVLVGSAGGQPMVLITVAPPRPLTLMSWIYTYTAVKADFVVPLDKQAEELFVDFPDKDPITLPLGPISSEYDALDACADKLAESSALAATGHGPAASAPVLLHDKETIWHVSYPPNLLLNRINGLVELRLTVDEKGRVRDCLIQNVTWVQQFGDDACRKFKEEARFEPARNAAGQEVPAAFRVAVMYIIYNW
ncbi:MAG TPA: energy transducer TonB [Croceibacterium sp.]|jgi:hypothetical protein|nr:energy transducer TonB [Croceibacterium sp.]